MEGKCEMEAGGMCILKMVSSLRVRWRLDLPRGKCLELLSSVTVESSLLLDQLFAPCTQINTTHVCKM